MPLLIVIYLVVSYYFSWWPFDETERAVNSSEFNVYIYSSSGGEHFLGRTKGLEHCGALANSYATSDKNIDSDWSYVCCRIADGSQCKSKHR